MDNYKIDIKENYIYQLDAKLLAILLLDKSSGKNIIWATDNYGRIGTQGADHDRTHHGENPRRQDTQRQLAL